MQNDVHAMVLTYNRRELLVQNLASLKAQTHPLASITIIDNGSTDGTQAAVAALDLPNIDYVRLEQNIGAARGFHHGIDYVCGKKRAAWIWIMDDDVLPEPTALAELVSAYERNFTYPEQIGFLVAQSVDGEGRANNVPAIDTRPRRAGECASWGAYLDQGIASIRATAVAGMLMPRSTYEVFGNLNPELVIWGEDTDYTFRITETRLGLLVGQSKIVHLRAQPGDISIFLEHDPRRVPNFYYLYRNSLYMRRRYMGAHAYVNGIIRGMVEVSRLAVEGSWWKAQIALRGVAAGIFFNPKEPRPDAAATPRMRADRGGSFENRAAL